MSKAIKIHTTKLLDKLVIMEGESLDILLNRQHNKSISIKVEKTNNICKLTYFDEDTDIKERHIIEWKDE